MFKEWKYCQPELLEDFEYNFDAALDSVPDGWMKSFIPQFKNELFNTLGTYADEITFYQIKQKFDELVVYWNFPDKDYYTNNDYEELEKLVPIIQDIIRKYTEISKNTCVKCGKAATYTTTYGYITPFCDDCEVKSFAF